MRQPSEKCEWCGKFGARRFLSRLRGVCSTGNPSGLMHLWLCARCERDQIKDEAQIIKEDPKRER